MFNYIGTVHAYIGQVPWRVSMGCMDELIDKNLPYFVGANLATLADGGTGAERGAGNREAGASR